MEGYRRRSRLCTMSFAWWTAKGLNTTRPTARFMTVLAYVDPDDLVWGRRWFDSTSAAARTVNVGQCVVMVHDTSSLNFETTTIHCLVTLHVPLQCRGQR